MIKDIRKLSKEELHKWLIEEAGVNHPTWFGTGLKQGGIELQQVPEEYIELLWFLKNLNAKNYLNVGVGKGGSFMVETLIQENLTKSIAVDNSSYWQGNQRSSIMEKLEWLDAQVDIDIEFHDMDSSLFLKNCKDKFDAIFIDGDHTYDGVKRDYDNALPLLEDGAIMIFHDINSSGCPGVVRLWNEIKNERCIEFVNSTTCGIGIFKK